MLRLFYRIGMFSLATETSPLHIRSPHTAPGWVIATIWLASLCCISGTSPALAAERLALVIGNSDYDEISSLRNPRNDADDIAERLQSLGFELHGEGVFHNLDERSLRREVGKFARSAEGSEIAFLYFAGHGMQFDGDPHLLPVDIPDDELTIVRSDAVGLNGLLNKLAGRADLMVAVFDACREIPNYKRQISRATRGGSDRAWRGLSRPSVIADSTLIAYSGGSGELVADGTGRNSPYTGLLLEVMQADNLQRGKLDVSDLFSEVSYQFRRRYRGQRPEVINQGVRPNSFYLASLPSEPIPPPGPLTGKFTVKTEPPDARVRILNIVQPYTDGIELALNKSYDVLVIADGYETWRQPVLLSESEQVVAVLLERVKSLNATDTRNKPALDATLTTGKLTVQVEPPDARIRIMNIAGTYTPGIELATNRNYDILVARDGYDTWRQEVQLTDAERVVAVVLNRRSSPSPALTTESSSAATPAPETGQLTVLADPPDAIITLANSREIYKPGIELPLNQTYEIQVVQDGYRPLNTTVTLVEQEQTVRVKLVEDVSPTTEATENSNEVADENTKYNIGSLTVLTSPADARVRIMNIAPVYSPGIKLETGREYRILVTHPGYRNWTETIRLEEKALTIEVTLEKAERTASKTSAKKGRFRLRSAPADARVCFYVSNQWLCDQDTELEIGVEYPVFSSANGFEEYRGVARLERDGQPLRLSLKKESTIAKQPSKINGKLIKPAMRRIPAGKFTMGSAPDEVGRGKDERAHEVYIDSFSMSIYETTFQEYEQFSSSTGRKLPDDRGWGRGRRPVINVSLQDARDYARWLSEQTGKQYRLPTEAEWEYAARAGSSTAYHWGNRVGRNRTNCKGCLTRFGAGSTVPAGSYNANSWGLHDMHGNVQEWTCSVYRSEYDGSELQCDTQSKRVTRAVRGGSWVDSPPDLRSAARADHRSALSFYHLGFRLVRDD